MDSSDKLQELRNTPVNIKRAPRKHKPKKSKHIHTFKRKNQHKAKEVRRRLAYYLHPDMIEPYMDAVVNAAKPRREFLIDCIKRYFRRPRHKHESMDIGLPKKDLKFFYDEVPLSIHERVQDHCMDREWNKRIPMYKVVSTAIAEMLIHLNETK